MKTIVKILNVTTFALASVTVASIFYEGMILEWLSFVGILIPLTDILFLLATIVGIFYYKKHKMLFISHLFSIFIICIGIIITIIFGKDMPKWLFVIWEFYILYFYGTISIKKMWNLND
ncbi:MAG: hypothetical protein FWD66_06345 [Paludibacter sp.]|nr:hypothetical protein [Paludibacter sp.]